MDLFVENLVAIKKIAKKIVRTNGTTFQVDELVNAAYIGYNRAVTNSPELLTSKWFKVLSRAKFDMFDYMRVELGTRNKHTISFIKKSNEHGHEGGGSCIVDIEPLCIETSYEDIDNKDFLDVLLNKSELTDTEWRIIREYFYDEKTLKTIGKELGLSEASICMKKKAIRTKLLVCSEYLK